MRRAAIVSPLRTAVGAFGGSLRPLPANALAAMMLKALVERSGIDPARIDDVVMAQWAAMPLSRPACRWRCPA
jgi:acetyl-CoA C-acetyltransferase